MYLTMLIDSGEDFPISGHCEFASVYTTGQIFFNLIVLYNPTHTKPSKFVDVEFSVKITVSVSPSIVIYQVKYI